MHGATGSNPRRSSGRPSALTPAIVVGSGLGALGALRLLNRARIPTYALTAQPAAESRSRWFRPLPGVRGTLAGEDSLAPLLAGSSLERGVLIPCSDPVLRAISELPPALAERFPSSTPAATVVSRLANKAQFAQLLEALDIPRPRTLVLQEATELEAFAGGTFEHLFLKPVDSASFMRRYGVKGCRVRDLADARSQLERLRADGQAVVVQEYVPGPGSNHFLIDGFASRGGEVRALFARRRLRMYPPDFGDSSHMVSVSLEEVQPAVAALRKILAAIAYRGIFSAEFKRDARDGVFRILEINARVWIFVEFAGRCGVDVCTLAYRDALGLPLQPQAGYRSGARLIAPHTDLAAARYAWLRGELTFGAWLRSCAGAQQPHFNWTDPAPAVHEWCKIGRLALRWMARGGPTL